MDRVARRGPLARAPGALKGGHFWNCQHFCPVEGGTLWRKNKFSNKSLTMPKNWKGDPLGFLNTQSVVKHQRNWRGTLWREKIRKKVSQCRKTERGDPLGFFNIHSVAKQQKNWRGTLWEKKFRKKSLTVPKKIGKGDPLVSLGMVCYAEKPLRFSSLDQIVQFGAIIFCRTFKNYFGQFVWIEKKRKATTIVAFHFMKRRLKKLTKSHDYSRIFSKEKRRLRMSKKRSQVEIVSPFCVSEGNWRQFFKGNCLKKSEVLGHFILVFFVLFGIFDVAFTKQAWFKFCSTSSKSWNNTIQFN